jgi:hypothetical protein
MAVYLNTFSQVGLKEFRQLENDALCTIKITQSVSMPAMLAKREYKFEENSCSQLSDVARLMVAGSSRKIRVSMISYVRAILR